MKTYRLTEPKSTFSGNWYRGVRQLLIVLSLAIMLIPRIGHTESPPPPGLAARYLNYAMQVRRAFPNKEITCTSPGSSFAKFGAVSFSNNRNDIVIVDLHRNGTYRFRFQTLGVDNESFFPADFARQALHRQVAGDNLTFRNYSRYFDDRYRETNNPAFRVLEDYFLTFCYVYATTNFHVGGDGVRWTDHWGLVAEVVGAVFPIPQ